MADREVLVNSRWNTVEPKRDAATWDGVRRPVQDRPVFNRGKGRSDGASIWGGRTEISYRTTERDKAPAREVLTPMLMGDPEPGRVTPNTDFRERRYGTQIGHTIGGRRYTESGPILLTFKEYAEYYGDTE